MVRPERDPQPDAPRDDDAPAEETEDTRGQAFARALERLPKRDSPPAATPTPAAEPDPALQAQNGSGNGNGHGAPPKLTSPDQITAPRLEASLKKLLGATSDGGRTARRDGAGKRNRTLPPPPRLDRKTQQRRPGGTSSKTKVTRIVVPRPPTETRDITKLPPLKPTRLLKAPPSKPPSKSPPTPSKPKPAPAQAPAEAAAAAAAAGIAAALGDLETTKKRRQQPPAAAATPASPPAPAAASIPVPVETPPAAGEATSEFENLLEGLLDSREAAASIPSEPTPQPAAGPVTGPSDDNEGFSADVQIFAGQEGGTEGNLSDFVSKILDEMDSIVDAPAGPPGSGGPPRLSRETGEFEDAFSRVSPTEGGPAPPTAPAPPAPEAKKAPSSDTRRSRETGEFEDSTPAAPSISPDELSALSDLFSED